MQLFFSFFIHHLMDALSFPSTFYPAYFLPAFFIFSFEKERRRSLVPFVGWRCSASRASSPTESHLAESCPSRRTYQLEEGKGKKRESCWERERESIRLSPPSVGGCWLHRIGADRCHRDHPPLVLFFCSIRRRVFLFCLHPNTPDGGKELGRCWWLRNNNPTWCRVWKTIFIMTARKKRWGLRRKIKSGKWETAGFLSRNPYLSDRSRWRISTPPLKKKKN